VVVVGGSLGGLNAALWLRDIGCQVEVFERTPVPLEDRGAGIVLNPATIQYLVSHTTTLLKEISAATNWFRYMDLEGCIAHEEFTPYRFTGYSALSAGLLRCFGGENYHRGEECIGFDEHAGRVTVRFATGRVECCDLLVFADGINSTGRRLLLPEIQPRYAGYAAWRGTIGEHELRSATFSSLHEAITYTILPDSHALSYPIPDRAGCRLANWLWYRNVSSGRELDDLLTGRDGIRFGTSVPPASVHERHIRRLREEANALPPAFSEMIGKTVAPFIQVIFDVAVPRMAFGRVCLIGDAAFTARPHAAAGTAKAAEDGRKLGQALSASGGDVEEALKQWEPGQLALGRQLVMRSRNAGERLQHGRWSVDEPLPFGLYRSGDSIFIESMEWRFEQPSVPGVVPVSDATVRERLAQRRSEAGRSGGRRPKHRSRDRRKKPKR
jgi:2,6-dihydroxypyridine 3-monooxygenase